MLPKESDIKFKIQKQEQELDIYSEDKHELSDDDVPLNVWIGAYVVVQFEKKHYPGVFIQIENNQYRISAMERSGLGWKWPAKKDDILGWWHR